MANTLTVKLQVTDANGLISGATATAGLGFTLDYTNATMDEFVLAAAGIKTVALSGVQKVVMIVLTLGTAVIETSANGGGIVVATSMNAAKQGIFFISEPTAGQAINWFRFTAGGAGCTGTIYTWN